MTKNLTLFSIFLSFLFGNLHGNTFDATIQYLNVSYLFNGDSHGEFSGDPVCVLSDGSAWKIHPGDANKYRQWNVNDMLHIQVRTSFYWFKREHKFELQNYTRNEKARVMLVQYPTTPLSINAINYVETGGYYSTKTIKDEDGNSYTEKQWIPSYSKEIYLNDGTVWRIESDNSAFNEGKYVYFAVHRTSSGFFYFFIADVEREAVWSKATRVL